MILDGFTESCRGLGGPPKFLKVLISLRESRLGSLRLNFSTFFLRRARQELSNALVGVQFEEILKFLKIHQKINFWLVLGVAGKSWSQEISIFEAFERLKIFENFEKKRPGRTRGPGPKDH